MQSYFRVLYFQRLNYAGNFELFVKYYEHDMLVN